VKAQAIRASIAILVSFKTHFPCIDSTLSSDK
jgi:hypothetical protein